jgi:pyrroline-5-carboxylate reductase
VAVKPSAEAGPGSIVVVGGGRMGTALVGGLLAAGWEPDGISVAEVDGSRREALGHTLSGVRVLAQPAASDAAVLAVKPADGESACGALAATGATRVVSIMAGVRTASLEGWLGPGVAVVRAMPNTPALIRAGVSALAPGASAGEDDVVFAESILGAVGTVVRVAESALDAVTGLSGSGPAYVFLVAEALIDAGVLAGLPRPVSRALALETLAGSSRMLLEAEEEPADLRAQVTSPGGTTAAGLHALERAAVRAAILDAVSAATARSAELGS